MKRPVMVSWPSLRGPLHARMPSTQPGRRDHPGAGAAVQRDQTAHGSTFWLTSVFALAPCCLEQRKCAPIRGRNAHLHGLRHGDQYGGTTVSTCDTWGHLSERDDGAPRQTPLIWMSQYTSWSRISAGRYACINCHKSGCRWHPHRHRPCASCRRTVQSLFHSTHVVR